MLPAILAIGLFALFALAGPKVKFEVLADGSRRVTMPEGRVYIVTRLGGGMYNVARADVVEGTVTFNQTGILLELGETEKLKSDMKQFPKNLFT